MINSTPEPQPVDKIRTFPRPTDTLEHRVSDMEKHNQIRRIESTDSTTYFDTDSGTLVINDPNGLGKITIGQGQILVTDENGIDRVVIGSL